MLEISILSSDVRVYVRVCACVCVYVCVCGQEVHLLPRGNVDIPIILHI